MQQFDFWQKQDPTKPLFPDILWNKPEQKSLAGKLGIIGGSKSGFAGIAESYATSKKTGIGEAKIILPDSLKKIIPKNTLEALFVPSEMSGGISKDALPEARALAANVDTLLLAGDFGKNSETAIMLEELLSLTDKWTVLSRDTIDLLRESSPSLVERENTLLVASFAQVQKLLQYTYYPKMLTFNMHLAQFVDVLHKFTVTYPVTLVTLHQENIVVVHQGEVVTMPWSNPMAIWRGQLAATLACYITWNPSKPLHGLATGLVDK